MKYDVVIAGAGVIGCLIARELSRYEVKICVLEKEADVSMGTSKANSAIIHAGYDARCGTLKALLNVRGNARMEQTAEELGVPFKRIGSLVLAFDEDDLATLRKLYENGVQNGVPNLRLLSKEETLRMEPGLSPQIRGALLAPSAGILCPYELTITAAENALANGAELKTEWELKSVVPHSEGFTLSNGTETVETSYLVNAAGLFADRVAALAGDESFSILPRRGEYMILDKTEGQNVRHIIFQPPTKLGKGILVTPTIDGNLLVGPNAHDQPDKTDLSTSAPGLAEVSAGALKSVPGINLRSVITSFTGLRAVSPTGDFRIAASKRFPRLIHAACIESPGLSSAPAIAEYVAELLKNQGLRLRPNGKFSPVRRPIPRFAEMSDEEKAAQVKGNPLYGHILCRCETVTEGEIVEAIRRGARNLDAIKRRTRQGMGRCQGGFCTPRVIAVLARELGVPMDAVTKSGAGSKMLAGKLK